MCAGLDAVGDSRNIHDDRLVHFVDGVLNRSESDRADGAAGRDHDRSARGGIIIGQGGGAGEGQIDRDGQGRRPAQGGGHGGHASGFSHGTAAQTQGDGRGTVVVDDRARASGGGEGGVGWVGENDGKGLVGLVNRVAVDGDGDGFSRLTGIKGERGGWDGHVVRRCGSCAIGGRIIDSHCSAAGGGERHREVGVGGAAVALGDRDIIDGERRKRVVVENGVGVSGGHAQRRVGRAGKCQLNSLIVLVQCVIHHRNGDALGRHTGCESECPGRQCVVHAPAGGGAAADRVIYRHRFG